MGCTNTLSEKEVQRGLRNVIGDGLATQVMTTLTTSVFLVAFALALGASDLVIGMLAAIPPLSGIMQIPTIYLVEKFRTRRSITMIASALSRAFLLVIAFIPLIVPFSTALPIVLAALVLNSLLANVGGCSFNSWMHDLVPQSVLGRFFSKKMLLSTAVAIPTALLAGYFVDVWIATFPELELVAYTILFVAGFIAGMLGIVQISKIPEPQMASVEKIPPFVELLKQPFQDVNFKNLIWFQTSWNFAVNLALPFLTVYMLRGLGMDMTTVVILTALQQLTMVAFFKIWGNLSDKYSHKSVLRVSGPLLLVSFALWASLSLFKGSMVVLPMVVGIHMLWGMSTAGVNLATSSIGLKLAPQGKGTSYMASFMLFTQLAAAISPLLGGMVSQYFEGWTIFFVVALVLGVFALHRLTKVKEEGEVDDKIVARELVVEMKQSVSLTRIKAGAMMATAGLAAPSARRRKRRNRGEVLPIFTLRR
jgi:MFS family permease